MTGIKVYMPDGMQPDLHIPYNIAKDLMIYGMIGYRDHGSEWGCALQLYRESPFHKDILVTGFELYEIEASAGYWEADPTQRAKHGSRLIEEGKIDELELWNGMFHTHPIGSSAHMSGTDEKQLIDLAGENYWAVSLICPANRDASVDIDKFLFHYADSRQFDNGVVRVQNMKPKLIDAVDQYEEYTAKMKEIMHKRVVTVNTGKSWTGYSGRDEYVEQMLLETEQTMKEIDSYLLPQNTCIMGDWVYVEAVCDDKYVVESLDPGEQVEAYLGLAGHVVEIVEVNNNGDYRVTSPLHDGKYDYWLCPADSYSDAFCDTIHPIAKAGTPQSRLLKASREKNGMAKPTKKMFRDAGLEYPEQFITTNK